MLETLRLQTLNTHRKETQEQVSNALSQLSSSIDVAMVQQAYMRKNPDNNGADQLIPVISSNFVALATAFNDIAEKMQDMQAVQAGTMNIDAFINKYAINLSEYSNGLI